MLDFMYYVFYRNFWKLEKQSTRDFDFKPRADAPSVPWSRAPVYLHSTVLNHKVCRTPSTETLGIPPASSKTVFQLAWKDAESLQRATILRKKAGPSPTHPQRNHWIEVIQ